MNQELWSKIIKGDAVINCKSNTDAHSLLKYLETEGVIWKDRAKLSGDLGWHWHEEDSIYYISKKKLTLASISWHKENEADKEVVDYKDLENS